MQLSRLISGDCPFVTNMPIYAASGTIRDGAFLTATANTASLAGCTLTATVSTVQGVNFCGVTQVDSLRASESHENLGQNSHAFNLLTSGVPSKTVLTTGGQYVPTCVNLDAMYLALYAHTTAAGTAAHTLKNFTASTGTTLGNGSNGLDVCGTWLYSVVEGSDGTEPTFSGSLRYVVSQATVTAFQVLTAMNVSTDSAMVWTNKPLKKGGIISATGDDLRSWSGTSATGAHLAGSKMVCIDNYIKHDSAPYHPLRQWVDDALDGLTGTQLYGEMVFTDPWITNANTA